MIANNGYAPPIKQPQTFKIRSVRELIDEFPTMREPIIDGLLRRGESMNIIAAPKTGKSWLSAGLGICIATGRKWLGRFQTTAGKVLIIDNELHEETSSSRLPWIALKMGVPSGYLDRLDVANVRGQEFDLNTLAVALSELDYSLIILDAWYRFIPEGSDENSNSDVTVLYNLLDSVAAKIGCAFVCIHHTSKGNQSGKSVTDVGSGAGAQSRVPDSHLTMREHEEEGVVVLDAAVRSFAPLKPFCLRWEFPIWTEASELDPNALKAEKSRRHKADADAAAEQKKQRLDELKVKLIRAYKLFPDGDTANKLKEAAGMNQSVFNVVNSDLLLTGLVKRCKVTKGKREWDGYRMSNFSHSDKSDKSDKSLVCPTCPTDGGISLGQTPPLRGSLCPSDIPSRTGSLSESYSLQELSDSLDRKAESTGHEENAETESNVDFDIVNELFPMGPK